MKQSFEAYGVVVCGGGLAGVCAAVAAARSGISTCLIQDRPVFGGNSSSEVRVTPHGAACHHYYARETGIISELLIEERAHNHAVITENGWTNSVWDMVLYDLILRTPNLTFHLNTSVTAVQKSSERVIAAVVCRVAAAETEITIAGQRFIDCTGDGSVADLAGCEWRMGSEARSEFNEPHAPLHASADTMGNSINFRAFDMGHPVSFQAPSWAAHYEDASFFYAAGRAPNDLRGGYWWIEIGVPFNTIYENETIRHELTRHVLGVWDWMKNRDPHLKGKIENWALDTITQVPGKRESRRIMGRILITEHDPVNRTVFKDEIAYGGWFIDLHTPGGLLAQTSEPASAENYKPDSDYAVKSYCGPYGIPLRSLIARDVDNLMMAGRNISVTHAALGTVRVMATTALMGQAAGTAAAYSLLKGLSAADVPEQAAVEIQQRLLRDGCFLPNYKNQDPCDLARKARVQASSEAYFIGGSPFTSQARGEAVTCAPHRIAPDEDRLVQRRGQLIAAGSDTLHSLSVLLSNTSSTPQTVSAQLLPVDHIWDYRTDPGEPVCSTQIQVLPGHYQWIDWPVQLSAGEGWQTGRYYRLDLLPNPDVSWHIAENIEPGHVAVFEMGSGRMRRYREGVMMSLKISPPQAVYSPQNILSGVTRPSDFTNLWRSNPLEPLPQWLQLDWDVPQRISAVEITFAGNLIHEYHASPPFYRDPQCVSEYQISADIGGQWQELVHESGNYQRLCKHKLAQPITTSKIRITLLSTNGDRSAAIYEVRCYDEK